MTNAFVPSHRVVREFNLPDGSVAKENSLVSDAEWTHGGKKYVEQMGWVIPLTPQEITVLKAQALHEEKSDTPVEPVVEVESVTTDEAPTKPVAKKAPVKKTAKKPATKTAK